MHRRFRWPPESLAVLRKDAAVAWTKKAAAACLIFQRATEVGAAPREHHDRRRCGPPHKHRSLAERWRPGLAIGGNDALTDFTDGKILQPTKGLPGFPASPQRRRNSHDQRGNADDSRCQQRATRDEQSSSGSSIHGQHRMGLNVVRTKFSNSCTANRRLNPLFSSLGRARVNCARSNRSPMRFLLYNT